MGRFKTAMKVLGEISDAHYVQQKKVDDMTRELSRRCYGADPIEVRKIATVLVNHAEVTWK